MQIKTSNVIPREWLKWNRKVKCNEDVESTKFSYNPVGAKIITITWENCLPAFTKSELHISQGSNSIPRYIPRRNMYTGLTKDMK